MDEYVFNVDNGYLEGLVRGFRSGIMNRADYLNLVQCETIEGMLVGAADGLGSWKWVCLCKIPLVPQLIMNHLVLSWLLCAVRVHLVLPLSPDLKAQLQATDYGNYLETAEAQERPKEQIVDPWQAVAAEGETSIDYDKLIGMIQMRSSRQYDYIIFFSKTILFYFQFNSVASESTKSCWPKLKQPLEKLHTISCGGEFSFLIGKYKFTMQRAPLS